jgi:hypothetical protein
LWWRIGGTTTPASGKAAQVPGVHGAHCQEQRLCLSARLALLDASGKWLGELIRVISTSDQYALKRTSRTNMTDTSDNPMGLDGFEFVEFASPLPNVLEPLFEKMGFSLVARHRSKDVLLYRQGGINFIVNREPKSQAACLPCAMV